MKSGKLYFIALRLIVVMTILSILGSRPAAAGQKVLFDFTGYDGSDPVSGLTPDNAGNFYGTTSYGGANGYGCVYELSPALGGGWTETVIYSFDGSVGLNINPYGGVIFDKAGNLYGTSFGIGVGDVYELSPTNGGGWSERVIYAFQGFNGDADGPRGNLVFDKDGNLFGTTQNGGSCNQIDGCGAIYELSPGSNGQWTETVLYRFQDNGKDGVWPIAGLILDAVGNLYGTTFYGGDGKCNDGEIKGCGTAFELSPKSGGGWTETVLHSFQRNGSDGVGPAGALILNQKGNLFGTTEAGGTGGCQAAGGCGTVFELSPQTSGQWIEIIVHNFGLLILPGDGTLPDGSLTMDSRGQLYGTTAFGGTGGCKNKPYVGCGTVFRLSAQSGGGWTEKVHSFRNDRASAPHYPHAWLVFDAVGNIFGTTGVSRENQGAVFELTNFE
jgi:uncharacterized repeat protein (TIGR03803 family)